MFSTQLLLLLFGSCALSVLAIQALMTTTKPQNQYLKEILMGRCYENPPVQEPRPGDPLSCPFVVDTFMGALEGHRDQDIDASTFDMYLEMTALDGLIKKDAAMFVWPPPTTTRSTWLFGSDSFMLPEATPGGSLVQGLVFCGTDQRMNCPVEYWNTGGEGAQWSFWKGIYANFAKKAQGRVRMVVLDDNHHLHEIPALWEQAVIPNLGDGVTIVNVVARNCQGVSASLVSALQEALPHASSNCTTIIDAESGSEDDEEAFCKFMLGTMTASTEASSSDVPIPSASVECDCPESIYAVLFWVLILFLLAGAFAHWSVRHYLQGYQLIPESDAVRQSRLPKQ